MRAWSWASVARASPGRARAVFFCVNDHGCLQRSGLDSSLDYRRPFLRPFLPDFLDPDAEGGVVLPGFSDPDADEDPGGCEAGVFPGDSSVVSGFRAWKNTAWYCVRIIERSLRV